jgi:hypothetical protein
MVAVVTVSSLAMTSGERLNGASDAQTMPKRMNDDK